METSKDFLKSLFFKKILFCNYNKVFFLILWYFFLYSTSFCFSSKSRSLYRSTPYCLFFSFFFSLEILWYLSQAFLESFFTVLIVLSWRIFRHLYACKKKAIKKSLKDVKMLQVNFIMIYLISKILVLLKVTSILKTLFKEYNRLSLFKKR